MNVLLFALLLLQSWIWAAPIDNNDSFDDLISSEILALDGEYAACANHVSTPFDQSLSRRSTMDSAQSMEANSLNIVDYMAIRRAKEHIFYNVCPALQYQLGSPDEIFYNGLVVLAHLDCRCNVNKQVLFRYQITACVGKGGNGAVYSVIDHKTNETLALKLFPHADLGLRESKLLQILRNGDRTQLIEMKSFFYFLGYSAIVMPLMKYSLYGYRCTSLNQLKSLIRQLVIALWEISEKKVIHNDLKPANVLIESLSSERDEISVKLSDFGNACLLDDLSCPAGTPGYVAPEIYFGSDPNLRSDMWSLGIVIVETFAGLSLRHNDQDYHYADILLFFQLGQLPETLKSQNILYFDKFMRTQNLFASLKQSGRHSHTFSSFLKRIVRETMFMTKQESLLFRDFVRGCLQYDPNMRLSPEQAMRHPFLSSI